MILINLFYYLEKVFILMSAWMTGKRLMKQHYLKKRNFYSNLNMEYITDADYTPIKEFLKTLK